MATPARPWSTPVFRTGICWPSIWARGCAESARSLLRLGILTICIPLGTQILAEIACAVLEKTSSGAVELPLGADGSVVLGVMFIVLSLVCRCAAEQMEVQK